MNWLHNRSMLGGDKEEKLRKKQARIIRASVWSIGLGVGLLVARYIAPLIMGESEFANVGFSGFGLTLLGYGTIQLAALAFFRKYASLLCLTVTYVVMPAILLWLMVKLS